MFTLHNARHGIELWELGKQPLLKCERKSFKSTSLSNKQSKNKIKLLKWDLYIVGTEKYPISPFFMQHS